MWKLKQHKTSKEFETEVFSIPIPQIDTKISTQRELNEKQNFQPQYSGEIIDQSYTDILSIRKQLKQVQQETLELTAEEKKLGKNKTTLLDYDRSLNPKDKQDGGEHSK